MNERDNGGVVEVSPLVRRLLAPNPSPFTLSGTFVHIVGRGEVAIIDPGPVKPGHVDRLVEAVAGERVKAIVITHNHSDHSPAARPLADATGAPIIGCVPVKPGAGVPHADDAFDSSYEPAGVMRDGERLAGEGWTLEAVATPGHTSNHLCFALAEEGTLFSGDHVMGWSTSIVAPPDGNMSDYVASLEKLLGRDDARYLPAHGEPIEQPRQRVEQLIAHRRERERQIIGGLKGGPRAIGPLVAEIYADVDPRLHPAAALSVLAHLEDLGARGIAAREGEAWRLTA